MVATSLTPHAEEEEESADTITLILVVALFIFCNSLALIINFLETSFYDELGTALNYLVDISNLLVVCNSSANFIIYYAFGNHFRRTLKWYMCHKSPPGSVSGGAGDSPRHHIVATTAISGTSMNGTGAVVSQQEAGTLVCATGERHEREWNPTPEKGSSGSTGTSNGTVDADVVSGHRGYAPMKQARVLYTNKQGRDGQYTERIYC